MKRIRLTNKQKKELIFLFKSNYSLFKGSREDFVGLVNSLLRFNVNLGMLKYYCRKYKLKKLKKYKRVKILCDECKREFTIYYCELNHRQFCNKKCYGMNRKGKYPIFIKRDDWKKALEKNKINGLYEKHSERMKNGGALKARLSNKGSPNKPEKVLIKFIEENNLPFNYVGDGKIWFKAENGQRFNPDFINRHKKIIVEIFGNYWHRNSQENDYLRIKTYERFGYKTIVIWEKELEDDNLISNKMKGVIEIAC